jgi:hypothetical protein
VAIYASESRTEFHFDPATRTVEFQKRSNADGLLTSGRFEILPEGAIQIGGSKQDMDHVAINMVWSALEHDLRAKGGRR